MASRGSRTLLQTPPTVALVSTCARARHRPGRPCISGRFIFLAAICWTACAGIEAAAGQEVAAGPTISLTDAEKGWLKAHPDICLGYTDTFQPEVIADANGACRGILVDILNELNRRLGTKTGLRVFPASVVIEKVKRREVDGILSVHPQYATKMGLLSTRVYTTGYATAFARKDTFLDKPSDLAGKKVAVIGKVFFSEQILKEHGKGATVLTVSNALEGLQKVDKGEADVFLGASLNSYLIVKYQLVGLRAKYLFSKNPISCGIAIRPDWPELVGVFNKGIASFSDEEIDAIVSKWVQLPRTKSVVKLTAEERTWLKAHSPVRFGLPEGLAPYVMVDDQGKQVGILVDFLDELNRVLGTRFALKTMPSSRILEMSANRDIDVIYAIEPHKAKQLKLLQTNVWATGYPAIYARQGMSVKTLDDMAGKTIVIRPNTDWDNQILRPYSERVKIIYAETPLDAMRMVLSEEADLYLGLTSHRYIITKYRLFGITQAYTCPDTKVPFAMGIRSDWPELVGVLNKGLAGIGKQGLGAIVSKWHGTVQQEAPVEFDAQEKAWLDKHHTVRVRVVDFPPFMMVGESGPSGMSVDYLKLIAKRTGVRFEFCAETRPFTEALKEIRASRGPDMIQCMMRTSERERWLSFSKSYMSSPRVIITRSDDGFVGGMDDLAGKTLAVVGGTVVSKQLAERFPGIRLQFHETDAESLRAVAVGESDAYVGNLTLASYLITARGLGNLQVAAPTDMEDHIFSFGIRPDWPELASIIDKGLDSITPEEQAAIRSKYLTIRYEHGITFANIVQWGSAGLAAALIVFGMFLAWNRQLARGVRTRTAALAESEDRFRSTFEQAAAGIAHVSPKGQFLRVNRKFCEIVGYSREEMLARRFQDITFPDDHEADRKQIRQLLAGTIQTYSLEKRYIRKDAGIIWVNLTVSLIRDDSGEPRWLVGVVEDITKRKKEEELLLAYQKRLRELASELTFAEERERRRIAGELHDGIAQSLAFARIQLSSALKATSDSKLGEQIGETSQSLREAIEGIQGIVMDLSSPSMNEIGLAAAISEWLEDQIEGRHGIAAEFVNECGSIVLDEDIRAVLFRNVRELATNAVKHAQASRIAVHMSCVGDSLRIAVEDDGVGFDPDAEPRGGKRDGGFGLFSIRERMADLGGSLEIVSRPGKGCQAVLTVPHGCDTRKGG